MLRKVAEVDVWTPSPKGRRQWPFRSLKKAIINSLYADPTQLGRPTSQVIQLELVDPVNGLRVLPVILDEVEVVGGCEQAGKCRRLRVPEWCGDNAFEMDVSNKGQSGKA